MNLDRSPSEIAQAAAEEVRALNHRTLGLERKAFTTAPDVANTVDHLATLIERLPQAVQQALAGLEDLEERQAIRMDTGEPSGPAVAEARLELSDALEPLESLRASLRRAAGQLSHMGGPWPTEDGDE